ncbi:MAG: FCD domain-containing protein [Ilumatobacter sp.]|uniref:GntR family transcriptional regulator n=1 Tax=Ilumatobacter sp. TaxID=1967498 RepID=UPI00260420D1|nr:FCD domain-containing protein [Ilumatobacter sp.]MDJ0768474.1 FCD domain-containing protein [Ilumatobacter sp.]
MSTLDIDSAAPGDGSVTPLTRVEETVNAIREDIVSGVLTPGTKLAVEHLRKRYGVGSSTIRESLSLLLPDGLVTARGQRGFAVAPISLDDLQDISSTRILLETHALRESIATGDDDWEAGIVATFHRLAKAQEAVDNRLDGAAAEWEIRNQQFHDATTAACGSRWVLHMLDMLFHHTQRYRRMALTDRSVPRDVHAEHTALMEATLARDADTACDVAAMHIQRTTDVLSLLHGAGEARTG